MSSFNLSSRHLARRSYRSRPRLWCVAVLAFGCAVGWGTVQAVAEYSDDQAIAALTHGGQVIYLRHADRFPGPREGLSATSTADAYADCSQQRNLTAAGRKQATQLGTFWRALGIPVGKVYANAQCRTRDTALLAFGHADVDPRIFDTSFVLQLLLQRPTDNTNTIVVGNDAQLRELTGVDLDYGEAALVVPDGPGRVRVAARLDLDDWAEAVADQQ
jgi:phosphohistidine phosphatase SixA